MNRGPTRRVKPRTDGVALYTLADPRDGRVVYAGQSVEPERRGKYHANPNDSRIPLSRRRWMAELASLGLKPVFRVVKVVTADVADEEEAQMIKKLVEDGGAEFNTAHTVEARAAGSFKLTIVVSLDLYRRLQLRAIITGKSQSALAAEIFDATLPFYNVEEVPRP